MSEDLKDGKLTANFSWLYVPSLNSRSIQAPTVRRLWMLLQLEHILTQLVASDTSECSARPVVKWPGGKRQLLGEILCRLPPEINNYIEPFVGGGALLYSMRDRVRGTITAIDYNSELTNAYEVVRDDVEDLIKFLSTLKLLHTNELFFDIRSWDRSSSFEVLTKVARAARFIYLNKTGFNGLYRVNSAGKNNVAIGNIKNPRILDAKNLRACSNYLKQVTMLTGDFEKIKDFVGAGDFVYLDPPYSPLTATANFTGYTDKGFDYNAQFRLKALCDHLDDIGANFMLSNSSASIIYDLYCEEYLIDEVQASRALNCKGDRRGKITEYIIRNYH